jgi:hypothetical protein
VSFPLVAKLCNLLARSAQSSFFGFLHSQPVLLTPSAPGPRRNLQESHLSYCRSYPVRASFRCSLPPSIYSYPHSHIGRQFALHCAQRRLGIDLLPKCANLSTPHPWTRWVIIGVGKLYLWRDLKRCVFCLFVYYIYCRPHFYVRTPPVDAIASSFTEHQDGENTDFPSAFTLSLLDRTVTAKDDHAVPLGAVPSLWLSGFSQQPPFDLFLSLPPPRTIHSSSSPSLFIP